MVQEIGTGEFWGYGRRMELKAAKLHLCGQTLFTCSDASAVGWEPQCTASQTYIICSSTIGWKSKSYYKLQLKLVTWNITCLLFRFNTEYCSRLNVMVHLLNGQILIDQLFCPTQRLRRSTTQMTSHYLLLQKQRRQFLRKDIWVPVCNKIQWTE